MGVVCLRVRVCQRNPGGLGRCSGSRCKTMGTDGTGRQTAANRPQVETDVAGLMPSWRSPPGLKARQQWGLRVQDKRKAS